MEEIYNHGFDKGDLYLKKLSCAKKLLKSEIQLPHCVKCLFYGVPVSFNFETEQESLPIQNYLPSSWKISEAKNFININCYSPHAFSFSHNVWAKGAGGNYEIFNIDDNEIAIHRGFIGVNKSEVLIDLIIDNAIGENFFSAMKWLLPRRMLEFKKILINSSCFIAEDKFTYVLTGNNNLKIDSLTNSNHQNTSIIDFKDNNFRVLPKTFCSLSNAARDLSVSYPIKAFFYLNNNELKQKILMNEASATLKFIEMSSDYLWNSGDRVVKRNILNITKKTVEKYPFYNICLSNPKDITNYL